MRKTASKLDQSTLPHIVIVGGGMVGVSLALLLSKQHLNKQQATCRVTLVEQYPMPDSTEPPQWQPSFDDRSTALSAGSVSILQGLGCWSTLSAKAEAIHTVHVSDRGHYAGIELKARDYYLDALGFVIQNRWLGQVLLQQLAASGVECLAPAKVTACKAQAGGYQLQVDGAQQQQKKSSATTTVLNADLLLIADGAESDLRDSLGIVTEKTDYQQSAMIANVSLDRPHGGVAYERFTDEGPIALLPLPEFDDVYRAALVWTLPVSLQKEIQSLSSDALVGLLQQRFGHRAGLIKTIGERHIYPLQLVQAQEQVRSNLVVIGNAAHFLHPVAGQGFNLALRDCQTLVECLGQTPENTPIGSLRNLKTYLAKQLQDQELTIGLTDRLVKMFSTRQLSFAIIRQLGLLGLNSLPAAKNQFAQMMMGVR